MHERNTAYSIQSVMACTPICPLSTHGLDQPVASELARKTAASAARTSLLQFPRLSPQHGPSTTSTALHRLCPLQHCAVLWIFWRNNDSAFLLCRLRVLPTSSPVHAVRADVRVAALECVLPACFQVQNRLLGQILKPPPHLSITPVYKLKCRGRCNWLAMKSSPTARQPRITPSMLSGRLGPPWESWAAVT